MSIYEELEKAIMRDADEKNIEADFEVIEEVANIILKKQLDKLEKVIKQYPVLKGIKPVRHFYVYKYENTMEATEDIYVVADIGESTDMNERFTLTNYGVVYTEQISKAVKADEIIDAINNWHDFDLNLTEEEEKEIIAKYSAVIDEHDKF